MTTETQANELDREIFQRELDGFVPDNVLDAHAHIWSRSARSPTIPKGFEQFDEEITLEVWRRRMDELLPGRRQGGLMIPLAINATQDTAQQENEFASRQALSDPWCRPSMWISPRMDPDYVRQEVRRLNVAGFKCYHTESPRRPTWDSDIPEFLPEELVRIADEEGLCITLHMVKARSVADPSNQHWIRKYCEKYPNMKLILAHAARSFNPRFAMEGMESLRGLQNLWCDTSAVTEVGAYEAIIDVLGHQRLLWGSDFAVSHMRGRYVAAGDSFVWIDGESVERPGYAGEGDSMFAFNGLESLRALKQAAWHRRLSDNQVEDIFFGNLAGILGIEG